MPLKEMQVAAQVRYRKGGELIEWAKMGRFDMTDTLEAKTGTTSVTTGGEVILSKNDGFDMNRALVGLYNAGDGNLDITVYAGGVAQLLAAMRLDPGEVSVFRLPNSDNAGDLLTAILLSGTTGLLSWIAVESDSVSAPLS